MKIFLSAIESSRVKVGDKSVRLAEELIRQGVELRWNLMSYYYARNDIEEAEFIRDNSREIEIDSGAHSIQHGKRVDPYEYTEQYCEFIKKFDRNNVIGYFEMDIDSVASYDVVLQLREKLLKATDKIIPVWHINRGIDEYRRMCDEFSGRIVAVSGFNNSEIVDDQYINFLAYAKKKNCKLHCLGMTRTKILDKVPFDFVDSSSWKLSAVYGDATGVKKKISRNQYHGDLWVYNYKQWTKIQDYYYGKWKSVSKD